MLMAFADFHHVHVSIVYVGLRGVSVRIDARKFHIHMVEFFYVIWSENEK